MKFIILIFFLISFQQILSITNDEKHKKVEEINDEEFNKIMELLGENSSPIKFYGNLMETIDEFTGKYQKVMHKKEEFEKVMEQREKIAEEDQQIRNERISVMNIPPPKIPYDHPKFYYDEM
ncbi:hypothetical protein PVAND_017460 [Polypedilum vanderplanki]|uniref:Uncharacterized protein n=1 Tax=Polypedilum vanderplanki TaxID=319348 RepID=A0A9J6BIB8_POLVA|nr:hypothetical protein PVAND_017460 [Polypedilum vanderplanki]